MPTLVEIVSRWVGEQVEGAVITGRDLGHLISMPQASRVLARLAKQGRLMRITRGAYVAVTPSRYGPVPPPMRWA